MSGSSENTMEQGERRILVVGKSGNGKSALCNTLVGLNKFKTGRSMATTTHTMQHELAFRHGRQTRVIDTPDVTNCNMNQREMEVEVGNWRQATYPFPTAVLLAVRCDVRYTAEEYDIYRHLVRLWGDSTLKDRLIVAFTFGDLQDNPIEEELRTVCAELQNVLTDACHRYLVFNNKAGNTEDQARQLLSLVDSLPPNPHRPLPDWLRYLPRGLLAVVLVSGLCFAATYTANESGWSGFFGFVFFASGLGLIGLEVKRKLN